MKKALISKLENNRICEVVDIDNEFEVSNDFYWIECPENVTTHFTFNEDTNDFVPFNIIELEGFVENGYKVARQIAYGLIGDQLDMIYKEIQATGTIAADGEWATKITNVKAAIPKNNPAAVQEWNQLWNAQITQAV